MSTSGLTKTCAWCGATFYGDKRHKYCSEECAVEAHRKQARERYRVRYENQREQENERCRDYYRRNTEEIIARSAAWYRQNTEYKREYGRNYYYNHKGGGE